MPRGERGSCDGCLSIIDEANARCIVAVHRQWSRDFPLARPVLIVIPGDDFETILIGDRTALSGDELRQASSAEIPGTSERWLTREFRDREDLARFPNPRCHRRRGQRPPG